MSKMGKMIPKGNNLQVLGEIGGKTEGQTQENSPAASVYWKEEPVTF